MSDGGLPGFAAFAAVCESSFALDLEPGPGIELILVEATAYGGPGGPRREDGEPRSFSLIFLGPLEPQLEQGTIALRHPQLGRLEIFVVPIRRDVDGVRYEAVFG